MLWKTILVPHDFSSSANHAAALARDEAKLHGAAILLLHVVDLPPGFEAASVMPPETGAPINAKDYAMSTAQKHLEDIAARLQKDGVNATAYILQRNGAQPGKNLAASRPWSGPRKLDEVLLLKLEKACLCKFIGNAGIKGASHLLCNFSNRGGVRAGIPRSRNRAGAGRD